MVEVFAKHGPLAGRRVQIADEDLKEATAEDGWALEIREGVNLVVGDLNASNPKWKIPGYDIASGDAAQVKTENKSTDAPAGKNTDAPAGQTSETLKQQPKQQQQQPGRK